MEIFFLVKLNLEGTLRAASTIFPGTKKVLVVFIMADEKLCLKWNDFQNVLCASFGELRVDNDFTDVTLACEDQSIKAHRLILSGCSPFFKRLLKTHSHPQPLIYMRGLKSSELVAIVNFLYDGETNIFQEELDSFLSLAEEFELKGLSRGSEEKEEAIEQYKKQEYSKYNQNRSSFGAKFKDEGTNVHGAKNTNVNYERNLNDSIRALVPTNQKENKPSLINSDTMRTIKSLFEKQFDRLICLKCDYTSNDQRNMMKHVETHIEGLAYPCNFCNKVFRSSQSFRNYKDNDCQLP